MEKIRWCVQLSSRRYRADKEKSNIVAKMYLIIQLNDMQIFKNISPFSVLAAIVEETIFCVHGGLSPDTYNPEMVSCIKSTLKIPTSYFTHLYSVLILKIFKIRLWKLSVQLEFLWKEFFAIHFGPILARYIHAYNSRV